MKRMKLSELTGNEILAQSLMTWDYQIILPEGVVLKKEYIYFSETKEKCEQNDSDFLGECNGVAYYFIYKKDEITTLDFEYLAKLKKASSYVIYADVCVLSNETMMKYNITFKKIPRDIKKV